jgi:amino acid permease
VEYKSVFTMDYQYVEFSKPLNSHYIVVLLQCISGIFYPFLNHQFIFPLLSNLKKPTKNRVKLIFIATHLYEIGIYLTIALLGYLLLSQHLNQIPISPLVITSIPTLPLMLGKLMVVGSIFFNLPLQVFTAR